MPFITLETAAIQIKQACEDSRAGRLPFFLLVGAGISSPPIPLASEIVDQCKAIAKKHFPTVDEPSAALPIDAYSHWFQKAFPQRIHRQRFLRELMNGKPISHANFRLAHLLLNKSVGNIVVTTNFDDYLSRALTLFGKQHIICDHPNMVDRIDPGERDDIQIMHVHGTYWYYDCCNLSDEIAGRAKQLAQSFLTIAARLDNILTRRVPLVIGYSGWDGDVVMSALRRRIEDQRLPYNLYWFCYRQASVESLPDWLKDHEDVYFVVPQPSGHEPFFDLAGDARLVQSQRELLSHAGAKGNSDKENDEPVLPAHKVLDELIKTFELEAPELTRDPLKFFAGYLRNTLPQEDSWRADVDNYFIRSVVERLERAKDWEEKHQEALRHVEMQLEKVRDALRRCQYREAIQQGSQIRKVDLTTAQLQELLGAIASSASNLNDNSQEELDGYEMVIEMGNILVKQSRIYTCPEVAKALINKGVTLTRLNRNPDAVDAYNEVIQRFGDSKDPHLRVEVARALINKGAVLYALKRESDAITAFEEIVKRFDDDKEIHLREQVARALVNKGVTLSKLKRHGEALKVYEEVLGRFGESTEPTLFEEVAGALVNKGVTLRALDHHAEAIKAYDEVLNRFKDSSEPALREEVARALINKGVTYSRFGNGDGRTTEYSDQAIAAYEEVVERFGDATEPNLLKQVARAIVNLGVTYSMLRKRPEAIAAYRKVLERFDKATEHILQEQVANAQNGIGFQLICEAKQCWSNKPVEARAKLTEARQMINAALEKMPEEPVFLGNRGYIEFLLGEKEEARKYLTEAINFGGETIRKVELDDAEINPVQEDEEFCELISSIPSIDLADSSNSIGFKSTISKQLTGQFKNAPKLS